MIKKEKLRNICKKYNILALYAFGSMAEKAVVLVGEKETEKVNDPLTDIDIGVVFLEKLSSPLKRIRTYGALYSEMEEIFSPFNLDIIFLQDAGIIIQFEAINGILLYSSDDDKRLGYEEYVIKYYQDWKPDYDQYMKDVLEAVTG